MRDSVEAGERRLRGPAPARRRLDRAGRPRPCHGLLPALGLSVQDVDDITLMVSELATNVSQHATPADGAADPELWVYQRTDGRGRDELVVKAFDMFRGGARRRRPLLDARTRPRPGDHRTADPGAVGHHPSRSRLRTPTVRGRRPGSRCPSRAPRAASGTCGGLTSRTRPGTCTRCSSSAASTTSRRGRTRHLHPVRTRRPDRLVRIGDVPLVRPVGRVRQTRRSRTSPRCASNSSGSGSP